MKRLLAGLIAGTILTAAGDGTCLSPANQTVYRLIAVESTPVPAQPAIRQRFTKPTARPWGTLRRVTDITPVGP